MRKLIISVAVVLYMSMTAFCVDWYLECRKRSAIIKEQEVIIDCYNKIINDYYQHDDTFWYDVIVEGDTYWTLDSVYCEHGLRIIK